MRRLPAVQTCSAMSLSTMIAFEVPVGHGGRAAVDVERDMRLHRQQMVAGDRAGAGDRRPAGVAGGDHAVGARGGDQRRVFERGLEGAETRLCQPHALFRDFTQVVAVQGRFENDRAGVNLHAAWPIVLEALVRGDGERLDALGIPWPAGHMHLRRADRGGHPAVHIAFQVADRLLSRRVIAERDVHVRIDQPRNGRRAVGIDHDVAGVDLARGRGADRDDAVAVTDDGIAPSRPAHSDRRRRSCRY